MKGWHVLRHPFIPALANKGVDQRIIDSFVGHQTEQHRQPYRHLYPNTRKKAINSSDRSIDPQLVLPRSL